MLYLWIYIIIGHLFLIWIAFDKNKKFINYFGYCLYIIQNYSNRKKNIYNSTKKKFQNEFYEPIIKQNEKEAKIIKKNIFYDILQYIILYIQFIIYVWIFYVFYIIIANILLFLDETLKD